MLEIIVVTVLRIYIRELKTRRTMSRYEITRTERPNGSPQAHQSLQNSFVFENGECACYPETCVPSPGILQPSRSKNARRVNFLPAIGATCEGGSQVLSPGSAHPCYWQPCLFLGPMLHAPCVLSQRHPSHTPLIPWGSKIIRSEPS